jgi:hypothetical protein
MDQLRYARALRPHQTEKYSQGGTYCQVSIVFRYRFDNRSTCAIKVVLAFYAFTTNCLAARGFRGRRWAAPSTRRCLLNNAALKSACNSWRHQHTYVRACVRACACAGACVCGVGCQQPNDFGTD